MSLSVNFVTIKSHDHKELAEWWATQLEATVTATSEEARYTLVEVGRGGLRLFFQAVDDTQPSKGNLHIDLEADDIDVEVARLRSAGAVEVSQRRKGNLRWVTLTDPEGNEFCVAVKR